ncbi:MAG TPA: hypothetical protein VGC16_00475, partial [Rhizomicrobium sp.]
RAMPRPATTPPEGETVGAAPSWDATDAELQQWRKTRKPLPLPWRQISLMAGLCFGLASFVLPADVNKAADWVLYALMAASFYASWRKRRA